MATKESLLSMDAVFVTGLIYHSKKEKETGLFRLQKIGYLSYTNLSEEVQSSLNISFDESWMGMRDHSVDRIVQWLVQSGFAVKTPADTFGEEYTHAYQLTDTGVDAYTQLGNTDHVLTRSVEERLDADVVFEINETIKETSAAYDTIDDEQLINECIEQQPVETGGIIDFLKSQRPNENNE